MSSKTKPPSELRPSARYSTLPSIPPLYTHTPIRTRPQTHPVLTEKKSVILLSPKNKVLLLHRVKGTSFASAHVFPGGNLDAFHDGAAPPATDAACYADGEVYRRAAVRECFEESGILLARGKGGKGELVEIGEGEREEGRRRVHGGEVKFGEWVAGRQGAVPDLGMSLCSLR